jgi:hypothetical protein
VGRCLLLAAALAASSVVAAHGASGSRHAQPARVTMITDSVGGVLLWVKDAAAELGDGLDLRLEARSCRKLVDPGCFAVEGNPPSALELIRTLGHELGTTIVIDVGYNDLAQSYGENLDTIMRAALDAGAEHVVWVTLEELQGTWSEIDLQIKSAQKRWPQLTVADWAAFSAGKPWFADGPHMGYEGAQNFAHFLRPIILQACGARCAQPAPLHIVTTALADAKVGTHYTASLAADGGWPPYRWQAEARLPAGLRLLADGHVTVGPRAAAGLLELPLKVVDSLGKEASHPVELRIRARAKHRSGAGRAHSSSSRSAAELMQ